MNNVKWSDASEAVLKPPSLEDDLSVLEEGLLGLGEVLQRQVGQGLDLGQTVDESLLTHHLGHEGGEVSSA